MGTGGSFPGDKVSGAYTDHTRACGAKVKNVWICTSIALYVFVAWYLIKHRDNFTITLPRPAAAMYDISLM